MYFIMRFIERWVEPRESRSRPSHGGQERFYIEKEGERRWEKKYQFG